MEDNKSWINENLKNFGFLPELTSSSKYIKKLRSKMGFAKANSFLNQVDLILENSYDPEFEITKLVGEDEELLKIVFSTGIASSVNVLNSIFDILDELDIFPQQIIELGGANGWALFLLNEFFEESCKMTLVEMNNVWKPVSSKINLINKNYKDFHTEDKSELIITIFGAPENGFHELVECVERSITNEGVFITALRIADDTLLNGFIQKCESVGLGLDMKKSGKLMVKSWIRDENFPILVFSKASPLNNEAVNFNLLRSL
jgi:hypothetical protein